MGYTHYWTQTRDFTHEEWAQIRDDMEALLKDVQHVQGIPLANRAGDPGTSPEITDEKIWFNGVGGDSHETFCLNRVRPPKEEWEDRRGWAFCKTACKPYDLAVTAALCYLATVPGPASHTVSSDGKGRDFLDGLAEARLALPRYANILDIPAASSKTTAGTAPGSSTSPSCTVSTSVSTEKPISAGSTMACATASRRTPKPRNGASTTGMSSTPPASSMTVAASNWPWRRTNCSRPWSTARRFSAGPNSRPLSSGPATSRTRRNSYPASRPCSRRSPD
jgi:hypothetical protein